MEDFFHQQYQQSIPVSLKFFLGFPAAGFAGEGEEEEEEEDVPEDLADLEPEEQQKRIKPMPWMPRNHFATKLLGNVETYRGSELLIRWHWEPFLSRAPKNVNKLKTTPVMSDSTKKSLTEVTVKKKVLIFSDPMVDLLSELGQTSQNFLRIFGWIFFGSCHSGILPPRSATGCLCILHLFRISGGIYHDMFLIGCFRK